MSNNIVHYTEPYFNEPQHRISVIVVGAGGTGSQVVNNLARLDHTLRKLGHAGLYVKLYDYDTVNESNLGRQMFSPQDLGMPKCLVLINRINRFFSLGWGALPKKYENERANIIITCVDNTKARYELSRVSKKRGWISDSHSYDRPYYWLDFGNTKDKGQVILGTFDELEQPEKSKFNTQGKLQHILDMFPNLRKHEKLDDTPSCSLAEALNKQDLFINSTLCQFGMNLLWKLFREGKLTHQGVYVNLKSLKVNPIPIAQISKDIKVTKK